MIGGCATLLALVSAIIVKVVEELSQHLSLMQRYISKKADSHQGSSNERKHKGWVNSDDSERKSLPAIRRITRLSSRLSKVDSK